MGDFLEIRIKPYVAEQSGTVEALEYASHAAVQERLLLVVTK
jgi:hypothetical protein